MPTTAIVPRRCRRRPMPVRNSPAKRDHDGHPGHQDRPARGASRRSAARRGRSGPGPALPVPGAGRTASSRRRPPFRSSARPPRSSSRPAATDRTPTQAESGPDRGDREQHRDPGRDQRTEHHQQQDQRDGDRGRLRLAEVERVVMALLMLASPASAIRRPGYRACTAATACWSAPPAGRRWRWCWAPGRRPGRCARPLTPGTRRLGRAATDAARVLRQGAERGHDLARGLLHARAAGEGLARRAGLDQDGF